MNETILRRSERAYACLIRLYPASFQQEFGREMLYVFSAPLQDAHAQDRKIGVFAYWFRTLFDLGQSLVVQHVEDQRGKTSMNTETTSGISTRKFVTRILLVTTVILLIPLLAMRFTDQVDWTLGDFMIVAALLLSTGLMYLLIRITLQGRKSRFVASAFVTLALIMVWVELAVGLFTTWGN